MESKDTAQIDINILRPKALKDYIGQENAIKTLQLFLQAVKSRGAATEHILFYGPPGIGKTTLSYIISNELEGNIKITSGAAITKTGDLAAILTNLKDNDVLFIDEIHRLPKPVEEMLYPVIEEYALDIIIGKGPSARTIQLELPPFTLIAATTRMALISAPLRSRFSGGTFRLEFYSVNEIAEIIRRSAKRLHIEIPDDAVLEIAKRSRATPRTANYFLKRVRDYAQVHNIPLSKDIVKKAIALVGVDELGLTQSDRTTLEVIIEKFHGGPVGIKTIAAATSEEEATIEEVIEPYLIQQGLLEKTTRGRVATKKAYEHLGFDYKEPKDLFD